MSDEYHFKCKKSRGPFGYLAWCAKTPYLGDGPLDVDMAIETHFVFADTEDDALRKLRAEVYN